MKDMLSLNHLRHELGRTWFIALSGIAWVISQVSILVILGPIDEAMVILQTTGTTTADYLSVFNAWVESGDMAFYLAHFILDDFHWVWYTLFFTSLLCRLFDAFGVSSDRNWFLLLPLVSGLLDWYENHLQHIFLSSADFSTIVDPLPLYSTLASDAKWLLSIAYLGTSIVLAVRLAFRKKTE